MQASVLNLDKCSVVIFYTYAVYAAWIVLLKPLFLRKIVFFDNTMTWLR